MIENILNIKYNKSQTPKGNTYVLRQDQDDGVWDFMPFHGCLKKSDLPDVRNLLFSNIYKELYIDVNISILNIKVSNKFSF